MTNLKTKNFDRFTYIEVMMNGKNGYFMFAI